MTTTTIFSRIPAKVHYGPPKLVFRNIAGKQYYWCYQRQRWIKFTKRCPYLA